MKRLLHKLLILLVFSVLSAFTALAQLRVVRYSENFNAGTTYCPGSANYDNWVSFRRGLDTSSIKFESVIIKGDNNATAVTGRTCSDKFSVRRLADAIKNGTAYNVTCGGNTWDISGAGTCVATGCAIGSDQVAISVVGAGTYCSCRNPAWSLNAAIGNQNWGGIATANCPPPTQLITLEFTRPGIARDMGCTGISPLDQCTYTQNINATFTSGSSVDINDFEYYVKVNSTTYGPYKTFTNLKLDSSKTITVYNNFTFTRNTLYTIRVWSANPNGLVDGDVKNDTFTRVFDFRGTLAVPSTGDTTLCGSQKALLSATPGSLQDSLVWFSDRGASNVVGYGRKVLSPFLISGNTYKFYVGSYNGLNVVKVGIGGGTNGQNGAMFDIRAKAGDLKIDSMHFQCWAAPGTTVATDVYLRTGSYTDPGAASTATMWTKIWSGNVTSMGTTTYTTHIPVTYTLKSGVQYAVYVNTPSETLGYATGGATINTPEVTIIGGYGIGGTFSGTFNPRTFNGAVFYTKPICPSALDSTEIKVNPAPFGAKMLPGTPHVTSPERSGTGGMGSPRVVAMGDTLAWNLASPTGYNDADHGTTWKITNTSLTTKSGRSLTGYSWTDPSATAAGRFVYTPATTEIDSQLIGKITFQDIGKNNCDSSVVFYMYVAPLPEPDFTRTKVTCEGDAVEFVNKSKIASGFLDHMWYFGDGDSSEAVDPIHFYPKGGVYYVTYKAISSIYGYERIKRDTITVSPLPNVNFRILNVCEGKTHQFVNTSTGLGTLTYKWNFGVTPGTNATSKDATYKYSKAGQYNVTLTVEDNGCPATRTKTAYLFHTPVSDFSYPSNPGQKFCSNVPVQFTNKSTLVSGILGQTWSFGDGEVGTVKNPLHQFKTGASYNVRLISITEFGCADTAEKNINIGSAPVVSWSNGQVCDQTPTQFTNGTAPISGFASAPKWSFGDGSTSTSDNPAHQFTTLGPKTVKLVVSVNNGCSDSVTKTLNVGTQAIADFSAQSTCSGKPVQFDNKSTVKQGDMVYEWDFGDGSALSGDADPVHTYNVTNSFAPNVTLKVTVGACESVVKKPLQVYELPNCNFTVTDDWTPGDGYRTIKVQAANTGYPFYRFKFSDGGSINAASGVYQFPYEGDFDITLYTRNAADCECNKTIVKSVRNSMGTTGVGEGKIKLYPNPSNGLVNVESGSRIQKISVYNVLGEAVEASVTLKGNQAEMRMQNLAEGVYLVKITTEQGVVTRSVSINR